MRIIDAYDLLQTPPKPINYLVHNLIPAGTSGDEFGPPGGGKSSVMLDLGLTVASGKGEWHGLKCASGAVVLLGGERSDIDTFQRDLHRAGKRGLSKSNLIMPQSDKNEDAIWVWDKKNGKWELTEWGDEITGYLVKVNPALVLLDTTMSVARGCDQLDNAQQYQLGETIRRWTKQISSTSLPTTSLTISHTNQASAKEQVDWRLNYLSRAGGNGLPGSLRWLAGLTRLRHDDKLAKQLGLMERAQSNWLIAVGVSKHNEMPKPIWTNDRPAIFELTQEGRLSLLESGCDVPKKETTEESYREASQSTGGDYGDDWEK